MTDNQHITPQHERVAIAHEQLLGAQLRATRVWTAVHNMQLVQANAYPEAVTIQAVSPVITEVMQSAPVAIAAEPVPTEIIDFPINKLEAERLAVAAALQQVA